MEADEGAQRASQEMASVGQIPLPQIVESGSGELFVTRSKRRNSFHDSMRLLQQAGNRLGKELVRNQEARDREHAVIYVLRGMAKGFLVYSIPISMISRKPAGFRFVHSRPLIVPHI
jgi:hypothetical protein